MPERRSSVKAAEFVLSSRNYPQGLWPVEQDGHTPQGHSVIAVVHRRGAVLDCRHAGKDPAAFIERQD